MLPSSPAWAQTEFGAANFWDPRRTARLVDLAGTLGAAFTQPLPEATRDSAQLAAAYRFFASDMIDPDRLLAPHLAATTSRVASEAVILAVQDTTSLNYSSHPAVTDLGLLGDGKGKGLFVHATLAVRPAPADAPAVPLGLLALQVWTRPPAARGAAKRRRHRPISEKESRKWLLSLAASADLARAVPATTVVNVSDRESDVYDLFVAPRPANLHLVVRAAWDRHLTDAAPTERGTAAEPAPPHPSLWPQLAPAPVVATVTVAVPARPGRPARSATLRLHTTTVTMQPPAHRARELAPVTLAVVWAHEPAPPPGQEALDWRLLTTLGVPDGAAAARIVGYYTGRWTIEVWHRVLKTGGGIEDRRLRTADRLIRCLTVYAILAWRVLYLTLLARVEPETPCTPLLEAAEWQVLSCLSLHTATAPSTPPTLGQAVAWIARLGGHQRRGKGRPAGPEVVWRGLETLATATAVYRLLRPPRSTITGSGP